MTVRPADLAPIAAVPRPLRVPKAGEMVAEQLRRTIISGALKEGDSLPLEKNLLSHFGVSRPTLREAFRMLEAEGLISISRGSRSGATVHRPNVDVAARYLAHVLEANAVSLDDAYGARVLIEPIAVRRMVERSPRDAAAALRVALADVAANQEDDWQYGAAVARFHRKLVELGGNRTLTLLLDLMHSVLASYLYAVAQNAATAMDILASKRKSTRAKEKLIELAEAGAAAQAEAYWRRHLQVSQQVLQRWSTGSTLLELPKRAA